MDSDSPRPALPSPSELARRFPAGFRFGVGDSDLQVTGEDHCLKEEGSQRTMWTWFAQHSGKVFRNETPGVGVDRYHRWEEDADLIAGLGFRHYRTSVSWARLLTAEGELNKRARDWYLKFFAALRERRIRVYATLYHWELPEHFSHEGGWKNRATVDEFVKHACTAVRELGEAVDEFFVLNEPWCSAHNSFYTGIHAPGESDLKSTLIAAHHLLLAQGLAFRAIGEFAPEALVGTVVNIEPSFPETESDEDRRAAKLADQFFNGWFLDPLFHAEYPPEMSEVYGESMPRVSTEDLEIIRIGPRLHALGINYYLSKVVRDYPESPLLYEDVRHPGEEVNGLGWSVFVPPAYPEGLRIGLQRLHQRYGDDGLPPLYITENGFAGDAPPENDEDGGQDAARIAYFARHLSQVADAVDDGVPVEGYFVWTLLDNYEWAEGYRPESKFGIVDVDRATLDRKPKASARWWRELLGERGARKG